MLRKFYAILFVSGWAAGVIWLAYQMQEVTIVIWEYYYG